MKMLPEKVEGKIFVLILIISVSMCLLAVRLISMSQESLVLSASQERLSARASHAHDVIAQSVAMRESLVRAAHERIQFALGNANANAEATQISAAIRITGESREAWSERTRTRAAATAAALENIRTLVTAQFPHYFVYLSGDRITLHASPDNSSGVDAANYAPIDPSSAAATANPGRQLIWMTLEGPDHKPSVWVRILAPLYVEGKFAGVTGADFPIESVLASAGLADKGFGTVLLYSKEGRILSGKDAPWSSLVGEELISTPPRADQSSNPASRIIERNGTRLYAYIADVQPSGWRVAAVANAESIYAQLTILEAKLAVSAVALAVLLVFLLRASFRQLFIKPVKALEIATRGFAQHGVANFPNRGNDEIGTLTHAFEEMVDSLSSREAELTIRNQQLKNEISGRLSAVESLRESERKFRTLFEKSSDAVLVFDGDHYIDCNEAAIEMFGYPSKESLLATDRASFHPSHQPDGRLSAAVEAEMIATATRKGEHRYEWVCQTLRGLEFWVEIVSTLIPYGGRDVLYTVWRDITARKREEDERIRLATALDQAAEVIVITDKAGIIQYVNPSFERVTLFTREESHGRHSDLIHAANEDASILSDMRRTIAGGKVWKGRIANTRKDGTLYQSETTISPVRDATGSVRNFVIVSYDVTKEATLEAQLIQAQKMEAIGELASGIAHEINTPTQYIGDNIRFFQESYRGICSLLTEYEALLDRVKRNEPAQEKAAAIDRLALAIDLDYLKNEVPVAIQQSLDGNSRVAEIVRAMKEFAHPGLEEKVGFDINHAIQNTIAVARNEWKYVADVHLDLDPGLPEVPCLPGSFNQVILNIVVNAAHAIADVVDGGANGKGAISISTRSAEGWAEIRIADTGTGIPEAIRRKIFDPFFTTKRAGKGTGQGLALVHGVIVDKHGGTVDVETEVGKGTTFIVRLPLADSHSPADELELAGAPGNG
jgi:PAS domain S-box-containing protein